MALEIALNIRAGIIMVYELFIGNQEISQSKFNFYWPKEKKKNIRVMMAIRKELVDKIIVDYWINLVNHSYFMLLEIWELDLWLKRPGKKTQVINVYGNWVGRDCIWDSRIYFTKRALKDVNWKPVIQGRVLIAGDINAHSLI